MPPRKRWGKRAGTRYERPLDAKPAYPGIVRVDEDVWTNKSATYARSVGLLAYHTHDSRRSEAGFPDLVFVGPRGLLVREAKHIDGGAVSDQQAAWIDALSAIGIDAGVWWFPRDWDSGLVMNELNSIARRGPRPSHLPEQVGKLLYLASQPASVAPRALLEWDADVRVNRALWRAEAAALLHEVSRELPVGEDEVAAWLKENRLPADASPARVLAAARATLTRMEP